MYWIKFYFLLKVTSDKLKEKFSLKGQITDVQLKYADDGKFRHFGFIGFKTDDEADEALKYFHNTYVGSCKIQVWVWSVSSHLFKM